MNRQHFEWLAGLFAIAVFAAILFGFTGFRTILAIGILFVAIPLMLLRHAPIDVEEKIFFSLFIGLGLFPLLAWTVNQALPSFRWSVAAAFVLVAVAGLFCPGLLGRLHKKQQ